MAERKHLRVLILVKTYPNPSRNYEETVCVAGVTEDGDWIRLYPVRFRDLAGEHQFQKYQWVELDVMEHHSDQRRETFKPVEGTIKLGDVIPSKDDWTHRDRWVRPLVRSSMCEVLRNANQCMEEGRSPDPSLAAVKPVELLGFEAVPDDEEWTDKQIQWMQQQNLFDERSPDLLEKIPWKFYYRYRCEDEACTGHRQSIIDWEIMQLYRNLKAKGEDDDAIIAKIRAKFEDQLFAASRDTVLFVGNGYQVPKSFMVIGVYWPPKSPRREQMGLDLGE